MTRRVHEGLLGCRLCCTFLSHVVVREANCATWMLNHEFNRDLVVLQYDKFSRQTCSMRGCARHIYICWSQTRTVSYICTVTRVRGGTHRTNGIGSIRRLIPPRILQAGPTPRLWKKAIDVMLVSQKDVERGDMYIPVPNIGKTAPSIDLKKSLPASTDAT